MLIPIEIKRQIYMMDKGVCHICGNAVSLADSQLDHIIPKAPSGRGNIETSHEYWNLRIAHKKCNVRRGAAKTGGQLRLPISLDIAKSSIQTSAGWLEHLRVFKKVKESYPVASSIDFWDEYHSQKGVKISEQYLALRRKAKLPRQTIKRIVNELGE